MRSDCEPGTHPAFHSSLPMSPCTRARRFPVCRAFLPLGNSAGRHNGLCVGQGGSVPIMGLRTQSPGSGKPRSSPAPQLFLRPERGLDPAHWEKPRACSLAWSRLRPTLCPNTRLQHNSRQPRSREVRGRVPSLSSKAPRPPSTLFLFTTSTEVPSRAV